MDPLLILNLLYTNHNILVGCESGCETRCVPKLFDWLILILMSQIIQTNTLSISI